ncbi:MAG: heavy metal translocating P-type ATPase, partial [Balneolaceae bacterium]
MQMMDIPVKEKEGCGADCCAPETGEEQAAGSRSFLIENWKPAVSFILLITGLTLDYLVTAPWFSDPLRLIFYGFAYLPVGIPVLYQSFRQLKKGEVFNEFFLMGIATLGAFLIGEYPEGVAVMLFYSIGEVFQGNAVRRARNNIKALLDIRSEVAHLKVNRETQDVHPGNVKIGESIVVRPGERVPLDGVLVSGRSAFDTSALTGESKPRHYSSGEKVLAGMMNLNRLIEIEVTSTYENSSISRILELVQNASKRKAKTELFIRSFAKVYTPAVVFLAALLVVIPAFIATEYIFEEWLYRALVFLVISCPCALVISIPLGYFGGIGAASRNGILVKGSNFLDALRSVSTVVFDKTGTLTKGNFTIQKVKSFHRDEEELLEMVYAVEKNSIHPIAKAINDYSTEKVNGRVLVTEQNEIPGQGIQATVDGKQLLIGSKAFMDEYKISLNGHTNNVASTMVHVAIDGRYEGFLEISDELKEDSVHAIERLHKLGVKRTVMLSGDRQEIADQLGRQLNMDHVFADLMPDQKAEKFEELKRQFTGTIAFVGDGINDAPVLALSDVGIAMGALGSDVAVETADVVIQTDHPSKVATAIQIAVATRNIVWQNIGLALGIKIVVLAMGAFGIA